MACKHQRKTRENRKDKYGQNVRLACSCGEVKTGWHTDLWKAEVAWGQNQEDAYTRYKEESHE